MSEAKKETKPKKTASKKEKIIKETKVEEKKVTKPRKTVSKKEVAESSKKDPIVKAASKKEEKKEIKKESALLNKNDQHKCSSLSKGISILAKIIKICVMIFVPFVFLFMIIIPFVFKKIEIESNIIKFDDASIIIQDDSISFKIGDEIHTIYCEEDDIRQINNFLMNNPISKITWIVELSLLLLGGMLILEIYLFGYIEKLFGNFAKDKTPFTDENTSYVLKIAKYLLAIKVVSLFALIAELLLDEFSVVSVIEVLIVFAIYYVFKYATELQKKIDTKIYD